MSLKTAFESTQPPNLTIMGLRGYGFLPFVKDTGSAFYVNDDSLGNNILLERRQQPMERTYLVNPISGDVLNEDPFELFLGFSNLSDKFAC